MTDTPQYILDRWFDAPRDLVWRCWTDPKLLHRWFGPNIETVIHAYDLRPGGVWLNEMKMGEMSDLSRMEFVTVEPPARLVWRQSTTDPDWNPIKNPRMPDWPETVLTTVTFEGDGDRTKLRLIWEPFQATDAEVTCFAGLVDRMGGGWESGFVILDQVLAEIS